MIERKVARDKVKAWLDGVLTAADVWQWAMETQYQNVESGVGYEDDLVRDIVDILAALPQDLITLEEAEVMLYGLDNPPDEADLAQNLLWNHIDAIDPEERRRSLAEDPFYAEFCGPVV